MPIHRIECSNIDAVDQHGMIGPGKIAFKKLKILLDRMMLRRTKVIAIHRPVSVCVLLWLFADRKS